MPEDIAPINPPSKMARSPSPAWLRDAAPDPQEVDEEAERAIPPPPGQAPGEADDSAIEPPLESEPVIATETAPVGGPATPATARSEDGTAAIRDTEVLRAPPPTEDGRVVQPRNRRTRTPGIVLDCGADERVQHVGVVFVHGIGSQIAGETLRDWGGAIVRMLADFRVARGDPADPVVSSQLDPAASGSLFIEVELPEGANRAAMPAEHWVMTEAWWASRVSPPSFAKMAEWLSLGGAINRIVQAMFQRRPMNDPRHRAYSESHPLERDTPDEEPHETDQLLSMLDRPGEPPIPVFLPPAEDADAPAADADAPQTDDDAVAAEKRARLGEHEPVRPGFAVALFELLGVGLFLQSVSALVLLLYGVLRSIEKLIPIGPFRDGGLTRPIDDFVLDWFGDVHVLLGDPAQSSSVRARLIDAIWDLNAIGCNPVVVVAHSGGAIVTYLALTDPATQSLRVDRVITLGEGLNLAWRLTDGDSPTIPGRPDPERLYAGLYRDLAGRSFEVRWTDFWSSQDPAPVGVLKFSRVAVPRTESISVWNRLSFGDDHGGYWDNDEEFVIPLLRRLEQRPAQTRPSMCFGTDEDHEIRARRRRERLGVLSSWTQLLRILPTVAIVHAFAVGSSTVIEAGRLMTGIWNVIPGHELVSGFVNQIRAAYPSGPAEGSLERSTAEIGVRVIAVALILAAVFAVRAPSERATLYARSALFSVLNVVHSIAWRALVLFLAILAGARFFGQPFESGTMLAILAVAAASVVAVADYLLSRRLAGSRARLAGWAPVRSAAERVGRAVDRPPARALLAAAEIAVVAALLGGTIFLALTPIVAMALYDDTGNMVLGSLLILAAFQALYLIGRWRWSAWDSRERIDVRRPEPIEGSRRGAGIQATLATVAGLCLYAGIVAPALTLMGWSGLWVAAAAVALLVLIGIGIDVVDAGNRRGATPGERIVEMIRAR
jgi:hypothetical protein